VTTTPTSDETPSAFTDEQYGAQRAEAAVWAEASAVITDRRGRVLVERVGYRDTRLLPGGAVDKGESPAHTAARELYEQLGVTMALDRGLAVDWVSTAGANAPPAMRFPGEVLHVFDGGTWDDEQIAAIRPRQGEIEAVDFVEPARLPELMSPDDARRALSALRARANAAGPVLLEDGIPIAPTVLDRAGVLRTPRTTSPSTSARLRSTSPYTRSGAGSLPQTAACSCHWSRTQARLACPAALPNSRTRRPCTHTAPGDHEEAAAEIGNPLFIGHLAAPDETRSRLRYAAALTRLGPAPVDPATGRTYVRILATPEQAPELFDWGEPAAGLHQAASGSASPQPSASPSPNRQLALSPSDGPARFPEGRAHIEARTPMTSSHTTPCRRRRGNRR
jgi:8-oxo-dGTP pyrophosphatase MutT (NUDIX family)